MTVATRSFSGWTEATGPHGAWDKPPRQGLVVPIAQQGQAQAAGFMLIGLNPYRPFDENYRGFVDFLVGQVAAGLADVRAYETEFYRTLESRHPEILTGIREKKQLDDQLKGALDSAVKAFSTDFLARKSAAA